MPMDFPYLDKYGVNHLIEKSKEKFVSKSVFGNTQFGFEFFNDLGAANGFGNGVKIGDSVNVYGELKSTTAASGWTSFATVPNVAAPNGIVHFVAADINGSSASYVHGKIDHNIIKLDSPQASKRYAFNVGYTVAEAPRYPGIEELENALWQLSGMRQLMLKVNTTGEDDTDGQPTGTVQVLFSGAPEADVAQCIADNNNTGLDTWGTLSRTVTSHGEQVTVHYSQIANLYCLVQMTVTKKTGWQDGTATTLKNAVVSYLATLNVGEALNVPALKRSLSADALGIDDTYTVTVLRVGTSSLDMTDTLLEVPARKALRCISGNITITYIT